MVTWRAILDLSFGHAVNGECLPGIETIAESLAQDGSRGIRDVTPGFTMKDFPFS